MTQVTAIDAHWLGMIPYYDSHAQSPDFSILSSIAELGSVFYSVKEKNFDDRGNRRKADKEFSKKAELEMEMARQREE